ncbi:rCG37262 [Rattus norvegicus]|uniref:RCG37262 n=1 Tax=Rattus norvegicus TaxID=10116 RepID=A6KI48_RAT|nr:rCG37262 [Rattus norvegicus]
MVSFQISSFKISSWGQLLTACPTL